VKGPRAARRPCTIAAVLRWVLAGVAAAAIPCVAGSAAADSVGFEAAAKGGFATNPFDNGAHPVRPGLGVRAGVTLWQLYLGASFMYYAEADHQEALTTAEQTVSSHDLVAGVEVGYSFPIGDLLIVRQQIGAGLWTTSSSCTADCGFGTNVTTTTNPYIEPGVTVLVPIGHLLLGGDANGLVLPVKNSREIYGAFSLHAQVGVRF